jgi:pilus assembly protein FimV
MTRDVHPSREASVPTTLSSLAHSGQVAAPRSRLGLIVGASAIVVGGAIGSALALRMAPASASPRGRSPTEASAASPRTGAQVPSAPAVESTTGTPPAAVAPGATSSTGPGAPPSAAGAPGADRPAAAAPSLAVAPPSPETRAALVAQIKDTLRRFVAWSHAHPGARCPDAAALGAALDPWGRPLQIVCSDQPADQVAGVLSYGPDGEPGTRDDVVSWALGADVTDLARGPRWSASRGMADAMGTGGRHGARPGPRTNASNPPPGVAPRATAPLPARPPAAGSNDTDGDGIPDRR